MLQGLLRYVNDTNRVYSQLAFALGCQNIFPAEIVCISVSVSIDAGRAKTADLCFCFHSPK